MDERYLVSVIIPTYKTDGSLEVAINSVLNQTYKNIEIIIVDDNEPKSEYRAKTEKIIEKYSKIENLFYIKHSENRNGSAARNTGFKNSNGEYIALLDDDDYFIEEKIKLQVEYLNLHPEYGGVYGGRFEGESSVVYNKEGDLTKELLSYTILPCTCSLMLRRSVYSELGGFNESYRRHQDFEFLLRFFEKYKIGVINKPVFYLKSNGVDNRLQCKEMEKQKVEFLNEFDYIIRNLDKKDRGFRRSIYALHFSRVFWSYMRNHEYINSLKILSKYSIICREKMFMEMYIYAKDYFKQRYK